MNRPLKKAVAFITFLALFMQIFVTAGAQEVRAAKSEPNFMVDDWKCLYGIENAGEKVVIPDTLGCDSVSLDLYQTAIKSLTVPEGVTSCYIYNGGDLEKIILPKGLTYFSIYGASNLKNVKFYSGLQYVDMYNCEALESLELPLTTKSVSIGYCPTLKKLDVPNGLISISMYGCPDLKFTVPATVEGLSCDDYKNIKISSENPIFSIYDNCLYEGKSLIQAMNTDTIKIKPGTLKISSNALCGCYATTTINIPDSVEEIDYSAFFGARNLKELKLPKGLVSLYGYAFSGLNVDSIEIPSNTRYVDDYAFADYYGTITLENNETKYLASYDGAIYTKDYQTLIYYPKNKTKLAVHSDCITLAYESLNGCAFSDLEIPESVGEVSLDLNNCDKLKTMTLHDDIFYVDEFATSYNMPKTFEKFIVSEGNPYYSAYSGCLYSKDKEILYATPYSVKDLKVARGCVTIGYYGLGRDSWWDYRTGDYEERKITVDLPGTIGSIENLYVIDSATVECGTTAASILQNYNKLAYNPIEYTFKNSNKSTLKMIVVPDEMQIKKGKKSDIAYTYPPGLNIVTAFTAAHENTNIYAKVSFTSSNKSVAKVSKKSGVVTAVKTGTATIKAKFVMPDGTKKTFKTKVTVK